MKLGRWEIEDFTNPSNQKCFFLCMEGFYLWKDEDADIDDFRRLEFRDLLVLSGMQHFTDDLIDYQLGWKLAHDGLKIAREKREDRIKNSQPYALNIAKIVKMFLTGETTDYKNIVISARDLTQKIDVAGKELFDQLKEGFLKEFERLGLNETELTTQEAKEEVEDIVEGAWFDEYGCTAEEILSDPYFLEKYRLDHFKPRIVSMEIVNKAISEIELAQRRSKKGAGAKVKNLGVGELAKRLSYLHRIRQFLNQKEYSSIKEIPLSNETCRFIYDYLEFWNSLPKDVKFEKVEKEKRANYIKSLIRNNENYFSKDFSYITTRDHLVAYDENLEMRIDLVKKVKDGLMTPDEYYKILTAPD